MKGYRCGIHSSQSFKFKNRVQIFALTREGYPKSCILIIYGSVIISLLMRMITKVLNINFLTKRQCVNDLKNAKFPTRNLDGETYPQILKVHGPVWLGSCIACSKFAVETHAWSLEFLTLRNFGSNTIQVQTKLEVRVYKFKRESFGESLFLAPHLEFIHLKEFIVFNIGNIPSILCSFKYQCIPSTIRETFYEFLI